MDENHLLNSNNLRNLKIAATKSKNDYDTPSKRRGKGKGERVCLKTTSWEEDFM
jgi:hypothetical protein